MYPESWLYIYKMWWNHKYMYLNRTWASNVNYQIEIIIMHSIHAGDSCFPVLLPNIMYYLNISPQTCPFQSRMALLLSKISKSHLNLIQIVILYGISMSPASPCGGFFSDLKTIHNENNTVYTEVSITKIILCSMSCVTESFTECIHNW